MSPRPRPTEGAPRRWRLLVALLAALLGTGCGAREIPQIAAPRGRVLIVGIDGTAPRLVDEWMEAGHLPHLQSLAEQGVYGRVRAHEPILSPPIWTSVATGKSPENHGIEGWVVEREGEKRLCQGRDRRGVALWNIVSAAGLEVATINWLATHPPEKIRGVVISELAQPERRQALLEIGGWFGYDGSAPREFSLAATWPLDWMERLARPVADSTLVPLETPRLPLLQTIRAHDELTLRLALEVDEETKPDVMMVLLQGNDQTSHFLWIGVEPDSAYPPDMRRTERHRRRAGKQMLAYYRMTDHFVGRLLERYGPDDLVIVLSDHGFEPVTKERQPDITGGHESEAAVDGVFFARGPGVPAGRSTGDLSVDDITPSVLAWLGLPVGRNMDGRVGGFLEAAPPDTIPSYDFIPIERAEVETGALDAAILERLESLGYLD